MINIFSGGGGGGLKTHPPRGAFSVISALENTTTATITKHEKSQDFSKNAIGNHCLNRTDIKDISYLVNAETFEGNEFTYFSMDNRKKDDVA